MSNFTRFFCFMVGFSTCSNMTRQHNHVVQKAAMPQPPQKGGKHFNFSFNSGESLYKRKYISTRVHSTLTTVHSCFVFSSFLTFSHRFKLDNIKAKFTLQVLMPNSMVFQYPLVVHISILNRP